MATATAHRTFANHTNHTYPLNLLDIINDIGNIETSTYSELASEIGKTVDYVAKKIGRTNDAFTMNRGNEFIIVYNSDLSANIPERIRFTLAHEIGHIVMNHFDNGDLILRRGGLSEKKYRKLEIEAETFAQELLAPSFLMNSKWTQKFVCNTFDVSEAVAKITLNKKNKYPWIKPTHFVRSLHENQRIQLGERKFLYSNPMRENILKERIPFLYTLFKKCTYYFCPNCKNAEKTLEEEIRYCTICGNDKLQIFSEDNYVFFHETKERETMTYKSLKVDEAGRLTDDCPICGNDHVRDNYCSVCGIFIFNKCSGMRKTDDNWNGGYEEDQPCEGPLLGADRYCPKCGAESTFYWNKLLKEWNYKEKSVVDISEEDLPF